MFDKIEAICGKKDADDLRALHAKAFGTTKAGKAKAETTVKSKGK